ncbi:MAG: chloramphenicol phosphotransferase CPT family protein [Oscillospiraceae bacterium]|nr:chloramphenicol phosphotransferase CPT family protein [Oscillospiraceae bacterium]
MKKGKIVYLNGVTSTGKTSIARRIQDTADEFFYLIGSDILMDMVGEKHRLNNYSKYEFEMFIDMYHFAKLLSDMGKNVIIDCLLFETSELPNHYQKMINIIDNNPLLTVNVVCPLEICRQRNLKRGDRGEFQSHEQDKIIDKTVTLDFIVYSDKNTPEECAEMILNKVFETFK